MTKYIMILKDKRKGTLTPDLLNQHIDHLREQTLKGNIALCGPFKDDDGALQIIEVESREVAESILKQDPFIREGYYRNYEILELIEANENNNWLSEDSQTKGNINK